jgi:hypothetical protein
MSVLCQFRKSPLHSITSSARTSSDGGMVRPRALAVLRLITSSNFSGAGSMPIGDLNQVARQISGFLERS